jgi:hypothetical protein
VKLPAAIAVSTMSASVDDVSEAASLSDANFTGGHGASPTATPAKKMAETNNVNIANAFFITFPL